MKIYRVHELPNGANLKTIGVYDSDGGKVYVKKGLPLPIEIVVLIHELGHHIAGKTGKLLYRLGAPFLDDNSSFIISRCHTKIWGHFFAITNRICRKWMPS